MDPNTETKKNSMKSRLLFLQSYLLRDTDVDHPARTDYLIRMCARASLDDMGADGIESLGIRDFNTVIGKARGFLNRSGS